MEPSMKQFVSITLCTAILTGWLSIGPCPTLAVAAQPTGASSQMTFANPEDATNALLDAMKQGDQKQLLGVLGPGSKALINSGDKHADAAHRQKFVENYAAQHKLAEVSPGH